MTATEHAPLRVAAVGSFSPVLAPVADDAVRADGGAGLRRLLVGLDTAAAAIGWTAAVALTGGLRPEVAARTAAEISVLVLLVAGTIVAIASQRLYLSRVCSVRAVEIARLGRACAAAGVGALLVPRLLPVVLESEPVIAGVSMTFVLLLVFRGLYRHWLAAGRRDGRFVRNVVVVGANDEGADLCKLLRDHPELGFRVAGVLGSPDGEGSVGPRYLGTTDDAVARVRSAGANGVIVAASAFSTVKLNELLRTFLHDGVHVQISSGIRGIGHRRLLPQPLACEPLFYVEPHRLAPWQLAMKRVIDLALAVVASIVFLPVIALAALAVKLQDGGSVLYRQERIGRHGKPFTIYKFRTMVPNADRLYFDLAATQPGRDGPLIKLAADPRRTRFGRILERSSIDELPQLWNVLRGDMSVVGPRPAQASEVAAFDEQLLARLTVLPGITGLWQVEARDNPHFSAYRRYDLFYLDNWSVSLDLAILVATFQRVALRGLELFRRNGAPEMALALHPIPSE
jgi:exopolysaccharide biosynthesis polyprenyl glycosylphosphotransferase